jgi:hypothetical protein
MPITWKTLQDTFSPEPLEWLARAQGLGLQWPLDVFEQIFIDHREDAEFADLVKLIDWSAIEWTEERLSGVALRRIGVPREYQLAVDEARTRTAEEGFRDEREGVMAHWRETKTWMQSPVVLAGDFFQTALQYELFVGFTRLGNILGILDRQDIPESAKHTIWLGRQIKR